MRRDIPAFKVWLNSLICLIMWCLLGSEAYAQVGVPPRIIVQPLGRCVKKGDTIVFQVTTVSQLTATYKWRLNGVEIADPDVENLGNTVSRLTVTNISSQNSGDYSVQVINSAGSEVSSNATLIALGQPAEILGSEMKTNGFNLRLGVVTGSNYVVSASTDLSNWTPLDTDVGQESTITFVDAEALNYTARFYRVESQ